MKRISTAALVLATSPLFAHSSLFAQQTGVAHPSEMVDDAPAVATAADPSTVATPVASAATAQDSSPAVTLKHHDLAKFDAAGTEAAALDADGAIVEEAPPNAFEVPSGTLVHARLQAPIRTDTTAPQTSFRATLTEPILNMGRTIVPAGSILEGRITQIHGGSRISGGALIHLQAQALVLPDGSRMPLNAAVIDTDQYSTTRIDSEGNIIRKDHPKETLGVLSLATGGAAAAGGVIAGVPGALVGAGIGAGVSTVLWLKQDREASLPAETLLILSLSSPLPIQSLVREPEMVRGPLPATAPSVTAPQVAAPGYTDSFVPAN